jgi:hypothetical protein
VKIAWKKKYSQEEKILNMPPKPEKTGKKGRKTKNCDLVAENSLAFTNICVLQSASCLYVKT